MSSSVHYSVTAAMECSVMQGRGGEGNGCTGGLKSSIGYAAESDTHSTATDSIVQCSIAIDKLSD